MLSAETVWSVLFFLHYVLKNQALRTQECIEGDKKLFYYSIDRIYHAFLSTQDSGLSTTETSKVYT